MPPKAYIALIIAVLILFGLFYCFSSKGRIGSRTETIDHPPFTIKKRNSYSTRYDINTASRRDNSRSYYRVYYKDQLITFPDALEANLGVSGLWKVYMLKDAPQPALLAGSKSVYLITEEDDNYKITTISEGRSDFASTQWLDSVDGQPDNKQELYSSDDTGKDCNLSGGQFLLINKHIVLDVSNLSIYPLHINSDRTEDYYASKVIAFSPDKESIVYMGNKNAGGTQYALLVYNFKTTAVYTLAFDRTETRLHQPYELHPDWLMTYFTWQKSKNAPLILEKRKLGSAPYWEGSISKEKAYSISPVKKEMLEVFATFVKDHLQLSDEEIKLETFDSKDRYELNINQYRLGISYFEGSGTVYFSIHFTEKEEKIGKEIINDVGNAFNELLRAGKHQSLFTTY